MENHDPWHIDESDFPKDRAAADQIRFLLRYAVLAPSSHNTQPWLFHIDGDKLEVYADRTKALPVVDPYDRALTISCGAAPNTLNCCCDSGLVRRCGRRPGGLLTR